MFFESLNAESGILFRTNVAARGLDISHVDWIAQYDAPGDPRDYIHTFLYYETAYMTALGDLGIVP